MNFKNIIGIYWVAIKGNETYKNSFNSFISVDKITSRPSLKETDETKDVFVNLVKQLIE